MAWDIACLGQGRHEAMKRWIPILAPFLAAMGAIGYGQSGNLVPQGAYCMYAGTWIPVASSTGSPAPESYPLVALYGQNGTTWYPIACDASGHLTVVIGSNTQIAFNNAGVESGDPNFTWNTLTQILAVNGAIVSQTTLPLAQIGIFNPTAMPVTTALANQANLNGLAMNNIGQAVAQTAHNTSVPRTCITTNSGNAYSCTTAPTFTPAPGDTISVNFAAANTSTATLNVNGTSAYPVYKNGGTALLVGADLQPNHWVSVILDSSNRWQIEGQLGQVIATQVSVTTIVDQTNFPLAEIGIFNPTVLPVTTSQPNLANLNGLGTNALGQAIPGMQKYQLKSQYANATTTPSVIWNFPVSASTNYHIECRGRYKTASGGAFELTLTGPASPTNIGYTFTPEVNLSANAGTYLDYEVGIANTYPTSINTTAVTAAATDMSFTLIIDLNNSTTAGVLAIEGNTISTDTLNVEIGSTCIVTPN